MRGAADIHHRASGRHVDAEAGHETRDAWAGGTIRMSAPSARAERTLWPMSDSPTAWRFGLDAFGDDKARLASQ